MKLLINAITLLIVCLSAFPSAKVIAKNANGQNTEMINKVIKSRNTELMTQKKEWHQIMPKYKTPTKILPHG